MTRARLWLTVGALYGLLAVMLDAAASHILSGSLSPEYLTIWHTAVRYQFYHALALIVLGVLASVRPAAGQTLSGIGFAGGTLCFSGSLYALCVTGEHVAGAVTPVGGVLLLLGWFALLWSSWCGDS